MTGLRLIENKINEFTYHPEFMEAGAFSLLVNVHKLIAMGIVNSIVNSSLRVFTAIPTMIYDVAYGVIFQHKEHLKDGALTIPKAIVHLMFDGLRLGLSLAGTVILVYIASLALIAAIAEKFVIPRILVCLNAIVDCLTATYEA